MWRGYRKSCTLRKGKIAATDKHDSGIPSFKVYNAGGMFGKHILIQAL